jgi:cytochrome c-type biogenesis protein CcmH/NrfG
LDKARTGLASGDLEGALKHYTSLIKRKREIDTVIEDLRAVLSRGWKAPGVWQALGDAYMKTDRLEEAVEAYKRGLEAA